MLAGRRSSSSLKMNLWVCVYRGWTVSPAAYLHYRVCGRKEQCHGHGYILHVSYCHGEKFGLASQTSAVDEFASPDKMEKGALAPTDVVHSCPSLLIPPAHPLVACTHPHPLHPGVDCLLFHCLQRAGETFCLALVPFPSPCPSPYDVLPCQLVCFEEVQEWSERTSHQTPRAVNGGNNHI